MLSRFPKPHLCSRGLQVIEVDYDDPESLDYSLQGVDTVISTISGVAQLQLIDAAVRQGVRRFAPAEFEGAPEFRPYDDPFDHGQSAALDRLLDNSDLIASTTFVCGVLYERFAPAGLRSIGMGRARGIEDEGSYIMDIPDARAQLPYFDVDGEVVSATVCLTSMADVARFVVSALDFAYWPPQLRIAGRQFDVLLRNSTDLQDALVLAVTSSDHAQVSCLQQLVATLQGRYDFADASTNEHVGFTLTSFAPWLQQAWSGRLGQFTS
ncbi:MAG: hypothetical protein M1817_005975 [Caeruleum heppii]|nr:MAG: hypothetical protein M1817_005975 [Caeruleum heppii]